MICQIHKYPIIIGGFYRSGTTLLRRLLDSHPNISCGPEVKFFIDFYGNYLKDDLAHIRFFKTIRSLGLDDETLLEIFGKAFVECHETAAKKLGKSRWADKNPENVLYLDKWYTILKGEFVFINVIRNPLDAMASLNETGFTKTVPNKFSQKVELYNTYLDKAFLFIDQHPEISYTLRYEDLAIDPKKALSELLSFLGETYDDAMLRDFFNHNRRSGIEDPKASNTRLVHTHSISRWKKDLSKRQIRLCHKHLSFWINKLHYSNQ